MGLIGFPNPVDEVSARLVAATVVALSIVTVVSQQGWMCAVITFGFMLRVLSGPKLSPIGLIVTRVIRPRLAIEPRECPGPPKRFAQAIGLSVSGAAAVAWLGFGDETVGTVLMCVLIAAASLEAFVGLCLGCKIFGVLMKLGVIPEPVCERCASVGGARSA